MQRNFLEGGLVILPRGCVLVFARNIFCRTDAAILCYQREQWLHNVNGLFPYASLLILFSFAACTYSSGFLYWAAYKRQLGYPSCEVFEKLSLLQGRQGDTCVWVFLPIAARTCFRIFCLFAFYFCQIHEMFNCLLNKMTNFCNGLFNFGHGQIL